MAEKKPDLSAIDVINILAEDGLLNSETEAIAFEDFGDGEFFDPEFTRPGKS